MTEYKNLVEFTRYLKPLKIIEIVELSNIPGETLFAIQVTNKNAVIKLRSEEIILNGFDLGQFNDFHAELIRQALIGKLAVYLNLPTQNLPSYKIMSKRLGRKNQGTTFIVGNTNEDGVQFAFTADALSKHKDILLNMDPQDVFDIGYTQGSELIIKEKVEIQRVKIQQNSIGEK